MSVDDTKPTPPPDPELDRTLISGRRSSVDPPPEVARPEVPGTGLPEIAGVRLEGEIARGGMGVVYRGVQEYLSRPVAVKVLAAHLNSGDFVGRFQREARILSGIAHPHIVGCYQAGVTDAGQCFMVMEFVDGPSLRRHIEANGPLPVPAVLRMGADLARALDHAWQAGVIHRDVKPENVVLQRATKVVDATFPFVPKLVDLGLARADSVADGLTAPGAVMGTYSTMAPEQFDAPDEVDFRADLYGLGCVLFHALTGKAAFPQRSMGAVIQRKLQAPAPNPSEGIPSVPAEVGALVQAMLAADRAQRPASYEAVVTECVRLVAGGPAVGAPVAHTKPEAPKPDPAVPPVPPPPPRWPMIVGGLAVLLAAGGGVWFWVLRETTPQTPPRVVGDGSANGTKPPEGSGSAGDGRSGGGRSGGGRSGGGDVENDDPKPPPPRVPPSLRVNVAAQVAPGEDLALDAVAEDADTPELTFAWKQVSGYPTSLVDGDSRRATAKLSDCVPGSALVFAVSVSDGDHAPVTQEVSVQVVDGESVPLFPQDPGDKLAMWHQEPADKGSWTTFDEFVINGYVKAGMTRLRMSLPRASFSLFGKIELEVADFATKKLTPAAGLMLRQQQSSEPLVLWLGPGEGDLVRGQLGGLASLEEWPPTPLSGTDGEATSSWALPAVLHFHLTASEGELRILWGAGTVWRRMLLGRPDGECCVELFVRDGLARFHDLRR